MADGSTSVSVASPEAPGQPASNKEGSLLSALVRFDLPRLLEVGPGANTAHRINQGLGDVPQLGVRVAGRLCQDGDCSLLAAPVLSHHNADGDIDDGAGFQSGPEVCRAVGVERESYGQPQRLGYLPGEFTGPGSSTLIELVRASEYRFRAAFASPCRLKGRDSTDRRPWEVTAVA